jgi:hypothetical protein
MYIGCTLDEVNGWVLIDDDFEVYVPSYASVWETIILEYEKRNLDVVKNLIRAIKSWEYTSISTTELFIYVINNTRHIEPFKDELEKYLMLL